MILSYMIATMTATMLADGDNLNGWPSGIVHAVRTLKAGFAFFSQHTLVGIPADWIARFIVLGGGYLLLMRRTSALRAAMICSAILLAKETFDIVAVLSPLHPRLPGLDDVADVLSGLAGIATAELIRRRIIAYQPMRSNNAASISTTTDCPKAETDR